MQKMRHVTLILLENLYIHVGRVEIGQQKMLDEGSIKAMGGFVKLFDDSQMEKLDEMNKGGIALMEEHKKGMAAKKATKVNG